MGLHRGQGQKAEVITGARMEQEVRAVRGWGGELARKAADKGETAAVAVATDADAAAPLDTALTVSHEGRVFEDLLAVHAEGGHCKSRTFYERGKSKFGKSIPEKLVLLFVECCPTCTQRKVRKPSSAGHKPIQKQGFGSRGQVDLIDLQSCADGSFKYLLNYQDHGIKLYVLQMSHACLQTRLICKQNELPLDEFANKPSLFANSMRMQM